jgi:hypothetical protein
MRITRRAYSDFRNGFPYVLPCSSWRRPRGRRSAATAPLDRRTRERHTPWVAGCVACWRVC